MAEWIKKTETPLEKGYTHGNFIERKGIHHKMEMNENLCSYIHIR